MCVVTETMWIRKNDGEVVERPYREAVGLVSRRLADPVEAPTDAETVPLEEDEAPHPVKIIAEYSASYSKAELVELSADNGLPVTGNKDELTARLLDANVELSRTEDPTGSVAATPENVPGENVSSPDELD